MTKGNSLVVLIDDPLLTPRQAGILIGGEEEPIAKSTLAIWRSTHRYRLPYVRVGRLIRYRRSDVLNFIKQRTVIPVEAAR